MTFTYIYIYIHTHISAEDYSVSVHIEMLKFKHRCLFFKCAFSMVSYGDLFTSEQLDSSFSCLDLLINVTTTNKISLDRKFLQIRLR